jgi:transposase
LVGYPWDPLPRRFNESRAVSVDKNKQTHISAVLKYSLLARCEHVALRLPPFHQELNPIEKMWAMVKNWVAMKNVTFQLQDVRKLAEGKFSSITKDEWLPVCKHVQEVEEKYIQNEHLVENTAEELVIILESSDSNMSEEDEDNSLEGILPLSPDSE